ncbi:MAG: alpha-amylase family glycosyl hydrolase, partial [Pseudorhodobacter sp.]
LDEYDARTMVGEVGEAAAHSLPIMADYTRPGRLHMAYSFAMLGPDFTARHFRDQIEGFFRAAPGSCPCWSFSNHDVIRHVSRWSEHGDPHPLARLAAAMLVGFEGSICLYQGEELGQTETEILHHELTDPPGIRFWPDYKGRDGCRTPMVWDASPHGGFTTGMPWLPVKPEQAARHVAGQEGVAGSVLENYRALLAFRRAQSVLRQGRTHFLDLPEPVLGFVRHAGGQALLCLYNLSRDTQALTLTGAGGMLGPSQAVDRHGDALTLGANGFVFLDLPTGRAGLRVSA